MLGVWVQTEVNSFVCAEMDILETGVVIVSFFKAMDDIGVVMTPFGDIVTVILVVNSYLLGFFLLKSGVAEVR